MTLFISQKVELMKMMRIEEEEKLVKYQGIVA
jgi:hypothetical protein